MDGLFYSNLSTGFQEAVSSPLPFLEGSTTVADDLKSLCKDIYDTTKINRGSKASGPLPALIIDGFDNEQIWQELELFNKKEAATCLKAAEFLALNDDSDISLFKSPIDEYSNANNAEENLESDSVINSDNENDSNEDIEESLSEEDGFHFEESDQDEKEENMDEGYNDVEKSEVDDDFFSLRKMEKFLDEEDRKYEMKKPDEGDIDYFEDIPSDAVDSSDDDAELQFSEDKSSRHLKYSDYFDIPSSSAIEKQSSENFIKKSEIEKISAVEKNSGVEKIFGLEKISEEEEPSDKVHSNYEKHQKQIAKKIEVLEDKALAPLDWQMKGEVKASSRPENSLLQETLQFDHVARPPTEITEEHTKDLESLIKQRIIDCAWDDVEKKYKPEADPTEYKKRVVLDSSQSKLTLGEIYEKEYLEKKQKLENRDTEEKEIEEHTAITKDMTDLFRKLDALSNFNFISTPPEPEMKLISNVRSLAMEEVQPVTQAESSALAPEEVYAKSVGGEEKSAHEKSSTDKKRERRKKKLRMKVRAKAKLEKMKKVNPNSEKVKGLEAIDQLKKAAKAPGSNTTILKESAKSGGKMTSQRFFSKLQDNGSLTKIKKKNYFQ